MAGICGNAVVLDGEGLMAIVPGERMRIGKGIGNRIMLRKQNGELHDLHSLPLDGCSIKSEHNCMVWRIEHPGTGKSIVFFTNDQQLKEEMRTLRNDVSCDSDRNWMSV